jgi:hypothetical protein
VVRNGDAGWVARTDNGNPVKRLRCHHDITSSAREKLTGAARLSPASAMFAPACTLTIVERLLEPELNSAHIMLGGTVKAARF